MPWQSAEEIVGGSWTAADSFAETAVSERRQTAEGAVSALEKYLPGFVEKVVVPQRKRVSPN